MNKIRVQDVFVTSLKGTMNSTDFQKGHIVRVFVQAKVEEVYLDDTLEDNNGHDKIWFLFNRHLGDVFNVGLNLIRHGNDIKDIYFLDNNYIDNYGVDN